MTNIFYNIEYSGIDLSGNRYIFKAKEAVNNQLNENEIVNLKKVNAVFFILKMIHYFKISSDKGIYNNKTLDMKFEKNVKANYEGSKLFAEKAEYSNSKKYFIISDNVKLNDKRGTIFADKLFLI